ncbi:MAG: hypothetical protein IPF87_06745 [Gemmatimonadetes bacterium]|nr:hypothetical protein [Gemmatimonadota bacterium]
MRLRVDLITRGVAVAGTASVAALVVVDPRWAAHPIGLAIAFVATILLRARPIALTKYSTLTGLPVSAMAGALILGASGAAMAVFAGVLVADWLLQRKALAWAWVNAGRESLALVAACGAYAGRRGGAQCAADGDALGRGGPGDVDPRLRLLHRLAGAAVLLAPRP